MLKISLLFYSLSFHFFVAMLVQSVRTIQVSVEGGKCVTTIERGEAITVCQ